MAFHRLVPSLIALLSLGHAVETRNALANGPSPGPGAARIQVTATVTSRATLRVLHQERMLVVTPEDVALGYVDAPAASRIEVRNNNRGGCLLVFEGVDGPDGPFGKVSIRGLGGDVEIGPGGGFVPHLYTPAPVPMELSYRFSIDRDARPGTYAWPFSVSVRPM